MKTISSHHKQKGQSLVEMAITITLLLTLLLGLVDMGIAIFSWIAIRDAAQEGALYLSIEPLDTAGMVTRVQDASSSPVDLTDDDCSDIRCVQIAVNYSLTTTAACSNGENAVTVTVIYHYVPITPFLTSIIGNEIPVTASITDTIIQPQCP